MSRAGRCRPRACCPNAKRRSRILDSGIVPDAGVARFNGTTKYDTLSSRHLPRAGASNAWFITTFGGVLAMSRTPLFAAVKKALALASRDNGIGRAANFRADRRRMMRLSAAAAGAAALSPVLDWSAYAKQERPKGPDSDHRRRRCRADRRLSPARSRQNPIVFEASNRWGGRMFTDTSSTRACSANWAAS